MGYLFTSESISEGHPDKIADQIGDALIDSFLAFDPHSKVVCKTLITAGQIILTSEVKSNTYVDVQQIARSIIKQIGYTKGEYMFEANSCGALSAIHEQSPDTSQGVERDKPEEQGAGNQDIMFGYAVDETDNYMPLALNLSHALLRELVEICRENHEITYLRPGTESQVTSECSDDNKSVRANTVVISTQHDDFDAENKTLKKTKEDIVNILVPRVIKKYPQYAPYFDENIIYHISPTGIFVIGGSHGGTGLTEHKIIVDTYGGKGAHGEGTFPGKDPNKIDHGVTYAMRRIAKNLVAAGIADEILVQVSYAIGVAGPIGIYVNTYGTARVKLTDGEIVKKIQETFPLRPYDIEQRLEPRNPIYSETASYGHMGRTPKVITKVFSLPYHRTRKIEVELFTWKKLDYMDKVKEALLN